MQRGSVECAGKVTAGINAGVGWEVGSGVAGGGSQKQEVAADSWLWREDSGELSAEQMT